MQKTTPMLISTQLTGQFKLQMSFLAAHAALADIEVTGKLLPDIESITRLGREHYEWKMLPRRMFGVNFNGHYISRYFVVNDMISWDTVSGNMLSKGSFTLVKHEGGVTVGVDIHQGMDLPIPALMVPALQQYIRKKVTKGVDAIFRMVAAKAEPAQFQGEL